MSKKGHWTQGLKWRIYGVSVVFFALFQKGKQQIYIGGAFNFLFQVGNRDFKAWSVVQGFTA